jgi:hypothetical protein
MSSFSYVQSNHVATDLSVSFSSNVTSGNLLVAVGGAFNSSNPTGCTDTLGNSYTLLGIFNGSGGIVFIYYTITSSSGANTITIGGWSTSNAVLCCGEYTVPSNFLISREGFQDIQGSGGSSNYTIEFPFDMKGSPTVPTEIMAITTWMDFNAHSWTMSNGTKRLDEDPGDGTAFLYGDYDTSTSPLSTNISTFSTGTDQVLALTMFLFTPGSGGGGTTNYIISPSITRIIVDEVGF